MCDEWPTEVWLGSVGYIAARWPSQPRHWCWGVGRELGSQFNSSPCSVWLMNGQVRAKGRFMWASRSHKHECEDASASNQWLFLCSHYEASLYQRKWARFTRLVSISFRWPPLRSLPIQSERNKRPLLSPFIQLSGCRMDWGQLIWQWQEASLLAQWPTSTKDRNHQRSSHCPEIDLETFAKPSGCH